MVETSRRALLRTAGKILPRALGQRERQALAEIRVLSFWRRAAHLYWQFIRDDGSGARPGDRRAEIPSRRRAGLQSRALANDHVATQRRNFSEGRTARIKRR